MMLKERTAVAQAALPVAQFRDHLRLGTGFADLGAEDAALVAYLRAAIAAIEGRTAKVLLAHEFRLVLPGWRDAENVPLPVAPVSAVAGVRLIDREGAETELAPTRWRLVEDLARPRLEAVGGALPEVPVAGTAEIDFTAGFGAWADLPVDLAQAVFLLAAQYFELRHDGAGEASAMPFGLMALIERWRTVRVLGGRG